MVKAIIKGPMKLYRQKHWMCKGEVEPQEKLLVTQNKNNYKYIEMK
jgi:hypothetical protein